VSIDHVAISTIKGTVCTGTEGLWELLKCKNMNTNLVGKADFKIYIEKILILASTHLIIYQTGDNIYITRGKKFREVIAPIFAKPNGHGVESALGGK